MPRKAVARSKKPHRIQYRIPRKLHLGRNYTISVVMLTPAALAEEMDENDAHPEERSPGGWDVDTMTIFLDGRKSKAEQWKTYFHELVHAAHDVDRMNNNIGSYPREKK